MPKDGQLSSCVLRVSTVCLPLLRLKMDDSAGLQRSA